MLRRSLGIGSVVGSKGSNNNSLVEADNSPGGSLSRSDCKRQVGTVVLLSL